MVNTPRLYVDLIFRQSGCFANWDPTTVLRVGDYGTVRENDGELDVQGNIYDDGFAEKYGLQLPKPVANTPSGEYVICSDGVRQTSLSSDIQLAVPQIANCTLKGQWEAGDGENALLLLPNTVRVSLPGSCKQALAERIYDDMKDFSFVTDVYHTPDYALFVNHSQKRSLVLALQAAPPGANPVSSPSAPSTAPASTPQALASALASAMPDAKVSVSGQWIAIGHVDVLKTSTPLDFGTVTMPVVQVPAPGSTSSTISTGLPNGGAQPSSAPQSKVENSFHMLAATHDSAEDAPERAVTTDAHASLAPHVAAGKAILPSTTDARDRELMDRLNAAVVKPYEVGVDQATVATSGAEVNAILSEMVPGETTTDTVTRKVAVLMAAQKQLELSRAAAADSTVAAPASAANAPSAPTATSTTDSSPASHGAPSSAPPSQASSSVRDSQAPTAGASSAPPTSASPPASAPSVPATSAPSAPATSAPPVPSTAPTSSLPPYVPLYKLQVLSKPLLVFGTPRLKDKTRMFFERAVGNGEGKATEDGEAKGDDVKDHGDDVTGYRMKDAHLPWDAAA
ncbi:uncharacterized protein SCHCODRAFT_02698625 [Schizophyllum commune H4-8]|uniref:uncharacterized protein n=1 Tax=Schizophyllum commune (strain H4-8 / FGSC 9210) TaxID=578458 RepID=UPI00215FD54A|nr:uncharacterized protein SCHCODRAFT_02698625 [Schizophyllum commune H4-8]KAI5894535.1 hypothetical protein SCHCODRAFT_02698625 [Schizophyllum commune H4-8]